MSGSNIGNGSSNPPGHLNPTHNGPILYKPLVLEKTGQIWVQSNNSPLLKLKSAREEAPIPM